MKFNEVAQVFAHIETTQSRLEMTQLLATLFARSSAQEANIIANISLGQLHPAYLQTQFNLAEKSVLKALAMLFDTSEEELNERTKKLGDLGLLFDEYEYHYKDQLSVLEVYKALAAIQEISGTGSQEEKQKYVISLLSYLDPLSAKYVVRIILGKLRLGFSDMTIIDALSWMVTGDKSLRSVIEDAYNVCADIGLITQTMKEEGIEGIKKMHARVGVPIRPAAAERLPSPQAVIEKIGPCVAQPKLDGFRLQIHIDNRGKAPFIKFFSRNLLDMSAMFPDLTKALEDFPVDTCIMEGEAIVFDQETDTFMPFQETVKRKRKHGIEEASEERPLSVFLFDLMYLNGKDIMHLPHEVRRAYLIPLVKKLDNDRVKVDGEMSISSVKDLETYFNECISAGLEGLVVKKPQASYQPGKRGFNWIKLKRHETGQLEDTIDCVILGYYAGAGKRAHFGIGAFLVGIYDKKEDSFKTIAKVGTGLKDEEWRELRKKCDALKIAQQPKNVVCAKELYPDVWVNPEIVCAIRADEITLSPTHSAGADEKHLGFALRFPRFMAYRPDKSIEEATTVDEVKRLFEDQFKK